MNIVLHILNIMLTEHRIHKSDILKIIETKSNVYNAGLKK